MRRTSASRSKKPDLKADPRAGAVTLAYAHDVEVSHSWHESIVGLIAHDLSNEGRLLRGGWIAMRCGTDGLVAARNKTVEQFLGDERADWLLWTDTDMGFAPDSVDRLMEAADPVERPMVGGLCFAQREKAPDAMGGYRTTSAPTIFDWVKLETGARGFQGRATYPINALIPCAGTGSAFLLIHRSVFEKVHAQEGAHWYDRVSNPTTGNQLISEDLSFCLRAGAVGVRLFVHTGVRTTHHKSFWLAEADYWHHAVAPPAVEGVDVLVPVMRRPQNAEPFMRSLRASTGLAHAYAVCDLDDEETLGAWQAAGASVVRAAMRVPPGPGTFAEKVNLGFRHTTQPWAFICGDDVRFHAGWLDHAQATAGDRYHVIGTNDLTNKRVTSGEHATHLLMRRSYVEEQGGSWDGPGVLAHEGYGHWFVDDEIVLAAKQRNAWAMALGSIVEHLHPIFGKAEDDDVYRLGQTRAKKDQAHFKERLYQARARAAKEKA